MAGAASRTAFILSALASLPGAWSAVPACAVENKGYTDPEVKLVNGGIEIADAQACQSACAALVTCQVFTYYINSGGCWLQGISGKVPPQEDIPGVYSGPSACNGTDADSALAGAVVPVEAPPSADSTAKAVAASVDKPPELHEAQAKMNRGLPTWASGLFCALIVGGVAAGSFVACTGSSGRKGKKKKAKRAVEVDLEEGRSPLSSVEEASMPLVADSVPTSLEVPVAYSAAPMMASPPVMAVPQVTAAPPVTTSYTTVVAPPVYTTAPVATTVVSPQQVVRGNPEPISQERAPMRSQDLFDRLDTNHDGVLTREEFKKMAPK